MRTITRIVLLLSLLCFSARAAVIPIKITDYPRTNTVPPHAFLLLAITNSVERTNYHVVFSNLFHQITSAIPVSVNSFTNGSNFFISGTDWTNISGHVRLVGGSTNTARFDTNNNRGLLIGDTSIATTWFGWPSDGQSYLSVYDGSTGHLLNRWTHGVLSPSTTNGSYAVVTSQSGVNPTLTEAFVVLTNGVIASEFDINMQRTGSYLLLGGNVNDGFVGIQHGAQVSTPIGGNLIRAKWGKTDRFFIATNGAASFFGSATNYGVLYAKSNFIVSGTSLLQGTLAVNGPALFLNGLGSTGITNTIGFQTLGRISLGDDPAELTTSSNTFRQYGPMHIHDGNLFLQDIAISANRIMYLTAGRQVTTLSTVDPTELGFIDGVTSPISSLVNNPGVVTNIIGVGIGISSNGGNWTITDLGSGGGSANPNTATNISGAGGTTVTSNGLGGWTITSTVGGGSGSMWTNQAEHSILRPIAGSTNFIGGGTQSAIGTNTVFSTVAGGLGNLIGTNVSWATIGGGLQNQVGAGSLAGTVAGGRGNIVSSNYTTIGGGFVNLATDRYSTIGGGFQNTVRDENATIAGGADNLSDGKNTTIGGGQNNNVNFYTDGGSTIGGGFHNSALADFATIAGGAYNTNRGVYSSVIGGFVNTISGNSSDGLGYATIGGGVSNRVGFTDGTTASSWGTIGGGAQNWIRERGEWSTIGGGRLNQIEGGLGVGGTIAGGMSNLTLTGSSAVTIGGGVGNLIAGAASFATIAGGTNNSIGASSMDATIGGGINNAIGASSIYTTIAGGLNNTIQRAANGATILGGNFNTIQQDSQQTTIIGGANNTIGSNSIYSAILGGAGNTIQTNTPYAFVIGTGAFTSNAHAFTVSFDQAAANRAAVVVDAANLHLVGDMKVKMTNGAALNAVLTSDANGVLSLQSFGGGGGGGSAGSGTFINSSNGFGTNTTLRAPNIPTNSFLMYDNVAVLYGDKVAKNWFYGWSAGKTNAIVGIQNTGIGWGSLGSLTSGSYNVGLGNVSLYATTTGSRNTASGFNANGVNVVGNDSTAFGYGALESNTADSNTGLGSGALQNNTIGTFNLGVGVEALQRNTIGSLNTAVGSYDSMILNVSGSNNASFGYGNLYSNTNGQENTSLGALGSYYQQSGDRNVSIGFRAGSSNWIGSSNIVIGAYVQLSTTNLSNRMNIGNAISGDLTNKFVGIGTNEPSSALHVRPTRSGQSYLRVDDTNGTPRLQAGVFIGASTIGALWFGNITPSSVNYSLASDGTGTTYVGGVNTLYLGTGGNTQWSVNNGGFLLASTDNTYDIGASGASRPRAVHLGTGGFVQAFSVAAPIAPSAQGAAYWNDGTNVCVVLRNSAGTLTTNKLSMTAWP